MFRKPLIISLICLVITIGMSTYVWLDLPDMHQYPVHWGPDGQPDAYGSKNAVLLNLAIFPIIAAFMTGLFWFLPKIEPLRENLLASHKAYSVTWILVSVFNIGLTYLIARSYLIKDGAALAVSPRLIVISMSILFIGIGNVMGKVRQNFFFGIRTPWTLSSELSWEKTHRIGGRLFVLTGLVSILVAIIKPNIAIRTFTVLMIAMVIALCVYSYIVWKNDPNKRK